jgi:predicted PurR-regulated permease PerM
MTPPRWRISLQAWVGLLLLGLALWLMVTYAGLLLEVAFVLFSALLLSLAIRPVADILARWRIPRGLTVLGVYAVLGGVLSLLGGLLAPIVGHEVARLQIHGLALLREALSRLGAVPLLGPLVPPIDVLARDATQSLSSVLRPLAGTVAGAGELIVDVVIVLVLTYFFVTDVDLPERLLRSWVPERYQPHARVVMADLRQRLTRWVLAQVAIALYFAVIFSAGLALLRVPFAFTIGMVGGVLEVIPYLGGAIAFFLAVLSALTRNPLLALWVAVFYVAVVEVESHVVAPTFYGRVIGLHPAAVLVALLVGAKVYGVVGVLFAVPVAVVLAAALQEIQAVLVPSGTEHQPGET